MLLRIQQSIGQLALDCPTITAILLLDYHKIANLFGSVEFTGCPSI